jgi:uncharacterized membrane protein YccF (DUF307 family)
MRTLGNIIWHIPFMGFVTAFATFVVGALFVITIIGAPIGLGLLQHAKFLITPFSSAMISRDDLKADQNALWKAYGLLISILYFPFGLILTIVSIVQIVGLFVSIVGIPVAIVLEKSLSTYFNPVNKICVPQGVADEVALRRAQEQASRFMR